MLYNLETESEITRNRLIGQILSLIQILANLTHKIDLRLRFSYIISDQELLIRDSDSTLSKSNCSGYYTCTFKSHTQTLLFDLN